MTEQQETMPEGHQAPPEGAIQDATPMRTYVVTRSHGNQFVTYSVQSDNDAVAKNEHLLADVVRITNPEGVDVFNINTDPDANASSLLGALLVGVANLMHATTISTPAGVQAATFEEITNVLVPIAQALDEEAGYVRATFFNPPQAQLAISLLSGAAAAMGQALGGTMEDWRSNFRHSADWYSAYGYEPGNQRDIDRQIGVDIEESLEVLEQLEVEYTAEGFSSTQIVGNIVSQMRFLATGLKDGTLTATIKDRAEFLDGLCDREVTGNLTAYVLGMDKEEADRRVLRANHAKLVDGKPLRDENGKAKKPEGWVAPDHSDLV